MSEKVLPYNRNIASQDTPWYCGPASIQTVLNSRGINMSERDIAAETEALEGNVGWDDQDGTDNISQIATVLSRRLGGGYIVRGMPNDPPSRAQVELLWSDAVASIDAGFGVVGNIIAPWNNFPRGTRGSVSPAYGGAPVFHYFTIMGYADDRPGGRHFWIADSGFRPFGYWCSLEQVASLFAGKGYTAKPVGADVDSAGVIDFIARFCWPLISDTKDIRGQLTGGRDKGQYPGWAQLGQRTAVDGVAKLLEVA